MTLQPGARIGPYEILSRVGAGGMGEVFRARDTRLGRTVALKALPAEFAENAQLRLRLQREARAISALAHPNICALYDVGEESGREYLVMEFLEGETLRARITKGPLPIEDALRFAIEIAGALETAHYVGIIHRDLKPDNIILTKSGAKLLDFGLARGAEPERIEQDAKTLVNEPLTQQGMIAGTLQYMAPELFGGAVADTRSDLFAFGAVLHEMLTGRPAFDGMSRPSLIASIVAGVPAKISALRPMVPAELDHVVQRCLDKEPDARWQSAHDVRLELQWIAGRGSEAVETPRAKSKRLLPWVVAAVMTAAAIAAAFVALRERHAAPAPGISAYLFPPPGRELATTLASLSISPDAKYVTFNVADDDRLWVREVAANTSRPIEGTQNAEYPFWSPDSRSIAFFADRKLKKVSLDGASPVALCSAEPGRGGSWNRKGVILFSPTSQSGIHRVADAGGEPVPVTQLDSAKPETTHRWATFLPDGNHFLYLAANYKDLPANDQSSIYVSSLDDPKHRTLLVRARSNPAYANGHLLYSDKGQLFAQRFDARTLKLGDAPFRIATNVETEREYFRAAFAVADGGTLVYRAGLASDATRLMWVDERGARTEVMRPNLDIVEMHLSPDQQRAAARVVDWRTGARDLYLLDLVRRTPIRLTFDSDAFYWSPLWSPDGKRLVFSRGVPPNIDLEIVMRNLDGDGTDEVLVRGGEIAPLPTTWSPDGNFVLYDRMDRLSDPNTKDIWMIEPRAGAKPSLFLGGRGAQQSPAFSPDGKWVVYTSSESGRNEIYAVRFPGRTAKTQISLNGATSARWTNDHELLVQSLNSVALVPVMIEGNTLRAGTPVPIERPEGAIVSDSRDGKRTLYVVADNNALRQSIAIVSEWRQPQP